MSCTNTELIEYIAEDVKKYDGVRRVIKAGALERMLVNKVPTLKIHPDPADEFTWPNVGPNEELISVYIRKYLSNDEFEEAITVQKMFPDGYEIVNGHHRWAAAVRIGKRQMRVKIANLTDEEDILKIIEKSKRTMRATFDLDEVLLVTDDETQAEPAPRFPYNRIFKQRLRAGAPALLNELQELGFDIWVYTRTVLSEEEIKQLFSAYGVKIDGCINGIGRRSANKPAKSAEHFLGNYELTVHIDNDNLIFTRKDVKGFDIRQLDGKGFDWVLQVIRSVKQELNDK